MKITDRTDPQDIMKCSICKGTGKNKGGKVNCRECGGVGKVESDWLPNTMATFPNEP